MDYKLKQRLNRWCPPDLRKDYNMNNQPCFVENGNYPIRSDFHRVTNSNIDKTVRCFRCGQTGHFYKQCAEIRIKSKKKLNRDFERLSLFIQRKTCENFPFFNLDDAEFLQIDLKDQNIRLGRKEILNKTSIEGLAARCRKLETENNALRHKSCDCKIPNPSMSRPIQNKGQNVNHDPSRGRNPSRGRRRQYFY
ncbi:unnamed protein product [Mytilus edulis]|uniref:CCHC-type domain-containing protein n=1 Tax=Mytilus edulis TaxID=6550 RepID=A0A8S3UA60_MYTED|nr:unnamed protein product [Mytilus edulis]